MKDNRLLKVLWGIVLAIFLCSALFIGISYFTGGDSSSKKKDNDTTGVSSSKTKDKNDSKSKSKDKSDEEKYRENKDSNDGNNSSSSNSSKSENNKSNNPDRVVNNKSSSNNNSTSNSNNNGAKKEEIKDKNDNSDTATSNASSTQGTYGSSADAKKYANDEIARLAKENKKHYSYTVDRNNKGEFVVNIKEGQNSKYTVFRDMLKAVFCRKKERINIFLFQQNIMISDIIQSKYKREYGNYEKK